MQRTSFARCLALAAMVLSRGPLLRRRSIRRALFASSCRSRPAAAPTSRPARSPRSSRSASGSRSWWTIGPGPAATSAPSSPRRRRRMATRCCSSRAATARTQPVQALASTRSTASSRSRSCQPAAFHPVVHPSLPARSVKELVALAKAKPGQAQLRFVGRGRHPVISARSISRAWPGSTSCTSRTRAAATAHNDLVAGYVQV